VLWNSANIYDKGGHTLLSTIAQGQDITDRKQSEEVLKRDRITFERLVRERTRELLHAEIELENAKRLADIGTLSATVAHELRNPLGVIRTAVYNIRRKSQNASLESHIVNIEKKILESDQIINNLLGYSRIKMPHPEKVKLYNILDECIDFTRERFEKKNLTIHKMYEPIKDIDVTIDPFQMREVFNNILDNACQAVAMPGGKIDVSAGNDRPNVINIRFKDNGCGIDQDDLGKVFDPFFTRKSKGTGLGLTICREMVHLNGGEIIVASKVGKGTTFNVTLPKSQ
jgi:signal transduction histidine kinase